MPKVDWVLLLPHLTIVAFALAALLTAAWQGHRKVVGPAPGWIATAGSAATLLLCGLQDRWGSAWQGMFVWDAFSALFCGAIAFAALLVCLATLSTKIPGEYYALLLIAASGLMFMVTSESLLMVYLSLELSTICLFVLTGFYRGRERSTEAALKFLVTAGAASAFFLFGVSWVYGAVGSTRFDLMREFFAGEVPAYAWAGLAMILLGLAFKIASAPFHLWAPDVVEGAPSPVAAFLSTASKAAGFVVLARLTVSVFPDIREAWSGGLVALAVATMIAGNLVALKQTNVKRLLAYSGVAQAGFILIAVAAGTQTGATALGVYVLLYVAGNAGAFLCVMALGEDAGDFGLDALNGLSRRAPALAFALLLFLLSLAGIPPLAGFVGKFLLFAAGMEAGLYWLVLAGAVASTVSLYYYLILAKRTYMFDPAADAPRLAVPLPLGVSIGVCAALTVAIGVYPGPWVHLAHLAAQALR
jgi:NADH-quinone oxidoreductase subunit N